MTITRAKKSTNARTPAKSDAGPITPEQFIAAAEPPAAHASPPPVTIPAASPATSPAPPPLAPSDRQARALAIVKDHLPWAVGAGLLPVPGVDLAAITGVQLKMLAKLAAVYGVPFREQAAKSVVAALMAAILEASMAGGLLVLFKVVPVFGALLGIATLPVLASAGTFAIGKVFITHFEAGGTFLDFNPDKVKSHFKQEFDKARQG